VAFPGKKGALLQLPRVPANMIELVSSTRKPLELIYQRDGTEVARQRATFAADSRRLLALPRILDATGFDSVRLLGTGRSRHRVEQVVLMWDADAESVRP